MAEAGFSSLQPVWLWLSYIRYLFCGKRGWVLLVLGMEVDEMQPEIRRVPLRGAFVELNKLLKFESLVSSGGEAKQVISGGLVSVDGVVETRVRHKLTAGNKVRFSGVELVVEGLEK